MAKEEVMDVIEETVDTIEETLDTIERIPKLRLNGTTRTQQIIILGTTAAVSAAVGGAVTYLITVKRMGAKFDRILTEQLQKTEEHYEAKARREKQGEFADPVAAAEALGVKVEPVVEVVPDEVQGVMRDYAGISKADVQEAAAALEESPDSNEPVIHNVFRDARSANSYFDVEEEKKSRSQDKPYVISHEEFLSADADYPQVQVEYFEEDDVLVDAQDDVIRETNRTVGDEHLHRFGYGSDDPNIIYVRNDLLEIDFEIRRNEGSYVKQILGSDVDDSLEHSDMAGRQGVRKFRSRD